MTFLERERLRAARAGDEQAFALLVAPYRPELQAHCRQLLGSSHDAEDAVQDALLRAWRSLRGFEGRGSLRAWLYRIATNCAMTMLSRRSSSMVPVESETTMLTESELGPPPATPETRVEQREVVELALVAAHRQLPSRQRAVLILREALDFSACEVAASLATTTTAVNSALQRARATVAERAAEPDRLPAPARLADARLRRQVQRYAEAWAHADVDGLVAMLAEDAA
jgi:RNA polymerase sigma-70 factor, ECF subfamily